MKVTILIQSDCGFCDQAKEILDRLQREYPLEISCMDIGSGEGQVLAMEGAILFPPGIFLDGVALCYGRPSERKLRKALDEHGRS